MKQNRLWIVLVVLLAFSLVLSPHGVNLLASAEGVEAVSSEPAETEGEGTTEVIVIDFVEETEEAEETEPTVESEPVEDVEPVNEVETIEESQPVEVETIEDEKKVVSQLDLNEDGNEVIKRYDESLPEGLVLDLDYTDYWISLNMWWYLVGL